MGTIQNIQKRRSLRIKHFDYSTPGAYFVTICTYKKRCLLSKVVENNIIQTEIGNIVEFQWKRTADIRKEISLDAYIIMPNHLHGIIFISKEGTARRAPTEEFGKPVSGSIPTIVRSFKSAATKAVNSIRNSSGEPFWQRNYYEHVIRNEHEFNQKRDYIISNPSRWNEDNENQKGVSKKSPTEYHY